MSQQTFMIVAQLAVRDWLMEEGVDLLAVDLNVEMAEESTGQHLVARWSVGHRSGTYDGPGGVVEDLALIDTPSTEAPFSPQPDRFADRVFEYGTTWYVDGELRDGWESADL